MTSDNPYTDHELLRRLQNDDAAAFATLYDRYWLPLLTATMKAVRSQPDAEDIVQELFTSIWRRRKELDISAPLGAYLFNSARYMGIRYIKRNITRENYLTALAKTMNWPQESVTALNLDAKELETRINSAINRLPEKMREVFYLSRKEQLSYKEIAHRLKISEETVKKQVYNALKHLRTELGDIPLAWLFYITILFL